MKKAKGSACLAFALALTEQVSAQEAQDQAPETDNFFEAVEAHFDKKVRQFITEQVLEEIGEKSLSELAKKIPGVVA
ncbi:hypothetical protein [Roseobacter denitrificans]|uniref:hypothetical protein n=1 Tax=Roseobacter denitrificans TaxID=2434 RepID=UPI00031CF209|nr:hypothetical protein [Roseobacter denitrificans]SFG51138.1 hypothetical protein SAMN05443635_1291 [Roseobacter denitrificans OCh 114]